MFALRCLAVCLSFFLAVYTLVSLLVSQGWRYSQHAQWRSPRATARFLLNLRTLPLLSALFVAVGIVLPSFLWLEPRAGSEPVGEIPLILGVLCLLLVATGLRNGLLAWRKTSRAIRGWLAGASAEPGWGGVALFRVGAAGPGLAVAGIGEPRVLISDAVANALTPAELTAALKHELAHVQRQDNLKKLLLRCTAFPGMAKLDAAWSDAAEMAADDAAVSNIGEALDLASALIKLSRYVPAQPTPALTTALIAHPVSALNARIERLVRWDQHHETSPASSHRWYLAPALIGSMFALAMSYGPLLSRMHQVTEWLVR